MKEDNTIRNIGLLLLLVFLFLVLLLYTHSALFFLRNVKEDVFLKISFVLFHKIISQNPSFLDSALVLYDYYYSYDGSTTSSGSEKRRTEVRLVLWNDGKGETSFSSDDIRGLLLGNSEHFRRVLSNARVVGPIAKVRDQTRGRREWRVWKKTW